MIIINESISRYVGEIVECGILPHNITLIQVLVLVITLVKMEEPVRTMKIWRITTVTVRIPTPGITVNQVSKFGLHTNYKGRGP